MGRGGRGKGGRTRPFDSARHCAGAGRDNGTAGGGGAVHLGRGDVIRLGRLSLGGIGSRSGCCRRQFRLFALFRQLLLRKIGQSGQRGGLVSGGVAVGQSQAQSSARRGGGLRRRRRRRRGWDLKEPATTRPAAAAAATDNESGRSVGSIRIGQGSGRCSG